MDHRCIHFEWNWWPHGSVSLQRWRFLHPHLEPFDLSNSCRQIAHSKDSNILGLSSVWVRATPAIPGSTPPCADCTPAPGAHKSLTTRSTNFLMRTHMRRPTYMRRTHRRVKNIDFNRCDRSGFSASCRRDLPLQINGRKGLRLLVGFSVGTLLEGCTETLSWRSRRLSVEPSTGASGTSLFDARLRPSNLCEIETRVL